MPGIIIIGTQWGDEGKGKIIDLLSKKADVVVRAQGGNNAGHTVVAQEKEYKFHLIPSGVLYDNVICCITGGVVIDPASLVKEITSLEEAGISLEGRLFISSFAHMILPYHRQLDLLYEEAKGSLSVGTTGKGIGPCYADKANRIGIQLGEMLNFSECMRHVKQVVAMKNRELVNVFQQPPIDFFAIEEEWKKYIDKLRPYISYTVEEKVRVALQEGKKVLFEGAHGSYLDQTFGTYPYVTSSSTIAAGVIGGAGVGPSAIDHVVGVVKAYTTRVGNGPLPTALSKEDEELFLNNKEAREIATTTGRKRRMGWFDAPLVRHSLALSGVDSIAIMKLDVLDCLDTIKICVGYELDGKRMDRPPVMTTDLERVQPIYETVLGWKQSTKEIHCYEELPQQAKEYLKKIESLCSCSISFISYGPEREKTLYLKSLF
ncbi:MAG: adenylosuccinate synthase [Verrucomicrobia bacterium]|nr:adenylosuccinate synthase [Verrucomicrobiota bacterium]